MVVLLESRTSLNDTSSELDKTPFFMPKGLVHCLHLSSKFRHAWQERESVRSCHEASGLSSWGLCVDPPVEK